MEIHRKDGEIEHRPKSTGGKVFDAITYGGIAGIGTFFLTIPIANMFKAGGRLHGADQTIRAGLRHVTKNEKLIGSITNVTNLMWGGNLMLIPVGIMEYFRTPIVKGLNRLFNDSTDPGSVEDAPKQTFGSILKGRATAWLTVFVGFAGVKAAVGAERYEGGLDKAGKAWANFLKKPHTVLDTKTGEMVASKAYNFGATAMEDVLATASSATLLYISSHAFAKQAAEKKAHHKPGSETVTDDSVPALTAPPAKPSTTVSHTQHDAAITAPEQAPLAAL